MNGTLLFMPWTTPTYAPLSLAALAGALDNQNLKHNVNFLDANLLLWKYLGEKNPENEKSFHFFRDLSENFYDQAAYGRNSELLNSLTAELIALENDCLHYANTKEMSESLHGFFENLSGQTLFHNPQRICFSILFLDQLKFSVAFTLFLKNKSPQLEIIFGGAGLTAVYMDQLFNALPELNAFTTSEGDEIIIKICSGDNLESIAGLTFRTATGSWQANKNLPVPLAKIALPDFSVLPLPWYLNPSPVIPVLSSRGCGYRKCRFCAHNLSYGKFREQEAGSMVSSLAQLSARHNTRYFYFADQLINGPMLSAISEQILKRGLAIRFHIMARPTLDLTQEILEKAFAAGLRWISWGVESGSQRLLDLCRKGTSRQEIIQLVKQSHLIGISNLLMMIFGLPTSTQKDLADTLSFLEETYAFSHAMTTSSYVLYQDTWFGRNAASCSLDVLGNEMLFSLKGKEVHSKKILNRQKYPEINLGGPEEIRQWERLRPWLGGERFEEKLVTEHYLLQAVHRSENIFKPLNKPTVPGRRIWKKIA